jgi:hypothetical protein
MIAPIWIIGLTGHRPKNVPGRSVAELEATAPATERILRDLAQRAKDRGGRADLLCGVAAGADLIAARVAEKIGMAVHVILPMPEAHYAQDFTGPDNEADWAAAQHFIQLAKTGAGGATFRVAEGSALRSECYYDQGYQIVQASDAVIAVWDCIEAPPVGQGETSDRIAPGRGGTADVVALAQADRLPYLRGKKPDSGYTWRPKPLIHINSVTGDVSGDVSDFACVADAGLVEIQAVVHALQLEDKDTHHAAATSETLIQMLKTGAKDWATKLRSALLIGSGLHFLASIIAAISAGSQAVNLGAWTPPLLAGIELTLVLMAIGFLLWSHWKHAQSRWLELRLATELTRGLRSCGRLLDPLFPQAAEHLPGWRRYCLSVGLLLRAGTTAEPDDAKRLASEKQSYNDQRLADQLAHYEKFDPHHRHWWHRIAHLAGWLTAVLAVAFIVCALVHKIHVAQHPEAHHAATLLSSIIYYFLPIALPLLAGAIASLQSVTDAKRRAHVYPAMVERLRSAQAQLPAIRTQNALHRFVRRTEEILLDELVAWYAAAKGISH